MKKTKKIIAVVMAIMTVASMFAFTASAATTAKHFDSSILDNFVAESVKYYGDANEDSKVTLEDVRIVLRACLKKYAYDTSDVYQAAAFFIADCNKDGYITTSDARIIMRTALGLQDKVYLPGREEYNIKSYPIDSSWKDGFYEQNSKNLNWCGFAMKSSADIIGTSKCKDKTRACNFYVDTRDTDINFDDSYLGYYFMMKIDFSKISDSAVKTAKSGHYSDELYRAVVKQAKALGYKFDDGQVYEGVIFFEDGTTQYLDLSDPDYVEPEKIAGICEYCGKKNVMDGIMFACTAGGCTIFICDMECPFCGGQIYANQCHHCSVYTYQ